MEGGGLMGNDGGGRQWWGVMEREGVLGWASHFVRGPSIFICAQLFSLVRGCLHSCTVVFAHARSSSLMRSHICSCTVVLIPARSSASFEWSWWTVSAGRSSCHLLGAVVSAGACHSWVSSLFSADGGSSMGGHRYPWLGIVVCGWGIIVRGWGIAFCGWGLSLYVDGGARRLLWFECHGR